MPGCGLLSNPSNQALRLLEEMSFASLTGVPSLAGARSSGSSSTPYSSSTADTNCITAIESRPAAIKSPSSGKSQSSSNNPSPFNQSISSVGLGDKCFDESMRRNAATLSGDHQVESGGDFTGHPRQAPRLEFDLGPEFTHFDRSAVDSTKRLTQDRRGIRLAMDQPNPAPGSGGSLEIIEQLRMVGVPGE
jgi:hypothetical protein